MISGNLTCDDLKTGEYAEIIGNEWSGNDTFGVGTVIYCKGYDNCIIFNSSNSTWKNNTRFSNNGYYIRKVTLKEVEGKKTVAENQKSNVRMVAINFGSQEDFNKFTKALNIVDNIGFNFAKAIRVNIEYLGYTSGQYSFGDGFYDLKSRGGSIIDLTKSSFEVIDAPPEEVKVRVGDYDATILENGDKIKVGCQTITFEEVEKTYQKMLKVRKS